MSPQISFRCCASIWLCRSVRQSLSMSDRQAVRRTESQYVGYSDWWRMWVAELLSVSACQPVCQSADMSVIHCIKMTASVSPKRSVDQLGWQRVSRSVRLSVSQSVSQCVSQSVCQSGTVIIGLSVTHSVRHSVCQAVRQSVSPTGTQLLYQHVNQCQSVNQAVYQTSSQCHT